MKALRTRVPLSGRALLAAGALALAGAAPALAQDNPPGNAASGKKVATAICQTCHGLNGLAKMPEMPTIAGSDATYLLKQLQAYKAGERQNEMMSAVAPMLDDQKMADVASYYASVKVEATPP